MERHRGQRRFWVTLEGRVTQYYWPQSIAVTCPKCEARADFSPAVRHCHHREGDAYRVVNLPVGGKKEGTGSCAACGCSFQSVFWPDDAYYKSCLRGGEYWAWNEDYLPILRARVTGDSVLERQLCLSDVAYHYFLSRLPKHVVIKRNRDVITRRIDNWLHAFRNSKRTS